MRTTLLLAGLLLACGSAVAQYAESDQSADAFDIRLSHEKTDILTLERLQARNPVAVSRAESLERSMDAARAALQAQPAGLQLIAAPELGTPEIVSASRGGVALSRPSSADREVIARAFLESNAAIYGLTGLQAAQLVTDVSYANPAGNLEWVRLVQKVNGLPVFRGEVTVALTPKGEVVRTMGQLAAAINPAEAVTQPSMSAKDVVLTQAQQLGVVLSASDIQIAGRSDDGHSITLNAGVDNPELTAELVYFPLGKGVLELAWSMVIQTASPDAYYTLVSATDGSLLFQKNITDYDSFTYRVYTAGNPAPFVPGPVDPTLGEQAPRVPAVDMLVESQSLTGDPWLAGLATDPAVTDGNNVEAGLDLGGGNGVDAPLANSALGSFIYASNPAPGSPPPGDAATTAASRNAAVVNLFYWTNRFHDLTYDLGFTEEARNFQQDNYGHGGAAGDRVSAEAQDSSGTNNANFATPADGGRGRMQMYIWNNTSPSRDGSMDADIIIHEYGHGLSNRLHGNASGLSTNMARGMGEGWGDYYAHSFLSNPSDPLTSIYTTGGYSTYQLTGAGDVSNYYYGIRRFPKAVMAATGGPGNLPFNPLTFADIDAAQIDLTDGAYPRGPIGSATADQVHNIGEVWSSALWEARGQLVGLHGTAEANQRMLQLVTDGMKLSPISPTLLQGRDAIIAADCAAYAGEDEMALWQGFAIRGMGFSAEVTAVSPAQVVEAFDLPIGDDLSAGPWTNLSCALPGRNPTPGETVQFQLTVTNTLCATDLTNVQVSIPDGNTVVIGNLPAGSVATPTIDYTIPGGASCGTVENVTFEVSSDAGTQNYSAEVNVGLPNIGMVEYTNSTSIDVPAGQPVTTSGPGNPYPSTINVAGYDNVANPVTGIEIVLHDISHEWLSDIDVLLVAPGGTKLIVLSDSWSGNNDPIPYPLTVTLSDAAPAVAPSSGLPAQANMYVRPTNNTAADDPFDAPAPASPYLNPAPAGAATFADFAGIDPNGNWSLYTDDDASADPGVIAGGWTLRLLYAQAPICEACDLDLGGTLTGLAGGNSITLQNFGGDDLLRNADGPFTFASPAMPGDDYEVTVLSQPTTPEQLCTVNNGSGTVGADHVTDIEVVCVNTYEIGGSLVNLATGTTVTIQNNGGDDLVLTPADTNWAFPMRLGDGEDYLVTVSVQPTDPSQTCTVTNETGTLAGADVGNVLIRCEPNTFTVGGGVTGLLPGEDVTIQLNGTESMVLSDNLPYVFTTELDDLSGYSVAITGETLDPDRLCRVDNASGTLAGADVTDANVACLDIAIFADGLED